MIQDMIDEVTAYIDGLNSQEEWIHFRLAWAFADARGSQTVDFEDKYKAMEYEKERKT